MRVVDMHCDTILELLSRDLKGKEASLYSNDLSIDLEKMKKVIIYYRILRCLQIKKN